MNQKNNFEQAKQYAKVSRSVQEYFGMDDATFNRFEPVLIEFLDKAESDWQIDIEGQQAPPIHEPGREQSLYEKYPILNDAVVRSYDFINESHYESLSKAEELIGSYFNPPELPHEQFDWREDPDMVAATKQMEIKQKVAEFRVKVQEWASDMFDNVLYSIVKKI